MLRTDNIGIGFAGRTLFEKLSFTLRPGDRVALAGPNGAGKSTLMKILCGKEMPDEGKVIVPGKEEVGYLPQEGVSHSGRKLFDEAEGAFQEVLQLQEDLEALGNKLDELDSSSAEYGDVLDQYGELQLRVDSHDLSRMRPTIETILRGLGFSEEDFERNTEEFSGGWQMRIALARLLLAQPGVLLLDEPTNHLDIESVQWLEGYLKQYPGAIVLISHDLRMLDEITTRTYAFENGKVAEYQGNYSYYLKEAAARKELRKKAYDAQQKEIQRIESFINRFRAKATKAKQVQSRIKQLEKIELIELEQEASQVSFRFPQPPPSGQLVMEVEDLVKSYDGNEPVLADVRFRLEKGEHVAVVGVNGAGKSTFARILAGVEPYDSGTCEAGSKVEIGYFAQDHADSLDKKLDVLEMASEGIRGEAAGKVRDMLGAFLFRGNDVYKKVSVLSGGERGRLALLHMLLQPANFLILDEPTNHLDMASQGVLQKAIKNYEGACLIVSHNRDFLDPIVSKVLEFRVGEPPRLYLGNVSDYIEKKAAEEKQQIQSQSAQTSEPSKPQEQDDEDPRLAGLSKKERRQRAAQIRQERSEKLNPLQKELETVEEQIAVLEQEKISLTKLFQEQSEASENEKGEKVQELSEKYRACEEQLQSNYSRWSKLSEEIESFEASA